METGREGKMAFRASEHRNFFILMFVLALLSFAPIAYSHTFIKTTDDVTDFNQHMLWAISLDQNGADSIPPYVLAHSGWQLLLVFLATMLGISFNLAGFLAVVLLSGSTVLILSRWYFPAILKAGQPLWVGAAMILGVAVAAPVGLLWFLDHLMYLGYIGITTYHNPTMIFLRPFAFLQFIYAYHCFYVERSLTRWQIVAGAFVSILAAFIKPSLAICILPALAAVIFLRWIQRKYVNLAALGFGVLLPTVFVLIWQFLLSYYENETGAVEFLPFAVMSAYSGYLGWKFLLSALFPIAVLVVFFKQAIGDVRMVLGWSIFVFGMVFTYLFAESGPRFVDGNFAWSGEIALTLLFAISTLFCLEISPKAPIVRWTLSLIWSLHILFGIAYYLFCLLGNSYY